jgi:hypothetical protein
MALFLQVAPRLFSAHFRSLLTLAPNNTLESFVASVLLSRLWNGSRLQDGNRQFLFETRYGSCREISVFVLSEAASE